MYYIIATKKELEHESSGFIDLFRIYLLLYFDAFLNFTVNTSKYRVALI